MQDSVFTKIVAGEIPAHKIYEDEKTLAFMDVYPKHEGHVLVIPKVNPTEFVWQLDDDTYHAVMATCKKVAQQQLEVLPFEHVHQAIVGIDVPYAHVHVIPFNTTTDLAAEQPTGEPNHELLASIAEKLRFA